MTAVCCAVLWGESLASLPPDEEDGIEDGIHVEQEQGEIAVRSATVDPATDRDWASLVQAHTSDVFHSPEWINVLTDAYGFAVRASLALDPSGEVVGGLVYADIDDFLGPRIVSLPFSDFCDPLVRHRADWELLFNELLGRKCPIRLRSLRSSVPFGHDAVEQVGRLGWHGIDLTRDPDQMWKEVSSSARRAIRKSESEGVEIRQADEISDLRAFFELHLQVRKYKYRLLAQPYRFFESIWERFMAKDRGVLLLASRQGRVIGGVMYLEWKDSLYYKFNASDPDELGSRPNDALLWAGLRYGHERGLKRLDFGVSDLDQEGLMRYKGKYATEEATVSVLAHSPDGLASDSNRSSRALLSDVTELLVDPSVPDSITETAGDRLYQYFS